MKSTSPDRDLHLRDRKSTFLHNNFSAEPFFLALGAVRRTKLAFDTLAVWKCFLSQRGPPSKLEQMWPASISTRTGQRL
jgi:hypothetical protein